MQYLLGLSVPHKLQDEALRCCGTCSPTTCSNGAAAFGLQLLEQHAGMSARTCVHCRIGTQGLGFHCFPVASGAAAGADVLRRGRGRHARDEDDEDAELLQDEENDGGSNQVRCWHCIAPARLLSVSPH